jgi:hypothetical protein
VEALVKREPPRPEEIGQDFSVSFLAANLWATPIAIFAVGLILVPYALIYGADPHASLLKSNFDRGFLLAVLAAVIVHEALHAVGFILGGAPRHTIWFGFHLATLTPYAHCAAALPARRLRLAFLLPALALGITPAFAGLILGWPTLTAFGALCTALAAGDFLAVWLFRRVPGSVLLKDYPTRIGCYVPRSVDHAERSQPAV